MSWEMVPLGELCKLVNGRAFKPSDWTPEGLRIVRIQNLNDSSKPFNRFDGAVNEKHRVGSGDVLLSWSGTPGTSFGCFVWDSGPAVLNQHIFKVHVDASRMDDDFFVFAVNSRLDEMISHAHGGVGLRHITKGKLEAIELPVPPLEEQRRLGRRIKECFERTGEVRRLREEGIREASALEESVFYEFLADGISRGTWPVLTLGKITTSSKYGTSQKANTSGMGTPVLRMGNIVDGYLDYSDLKHVELPEDEKQKYRLKVGDILVNRTNSLELVGKAAMFDRQDGDWVYASYLVRVRVDSARALPEYVAGVINSRLGRDFVRGTARRAIGMVNINAKEIARFPIPLPPLDEQRRVVDLMREARSAAQQLRSELAAAPVDELASSVLRHAFAG